MKHWINTRVVSKINRNGTFTDLVREGYWYDGPMALATTPPTMEVTNWAFYNDGTESGSVIIGTANNNQTLEVDTVYQVRFGLEETSGNAGKNMTAQLQYNKGGAGWNDVNAASSVVQSAAGGLTDGGDTTQRITSFTFDSSNQGQDEVDGLAGGSTADLLSNGMEVVYSFQILSGDVADEDTIVLKIVDDEGADFDTYNQVDPTITVNEAATPETVVIDEMIHTWTGQAVTSYLDITAVIDEMVHTWTGQAVEIYLDILETIDEMSLTYTGQNIQDNVVVNITKATLTWTGSALGVIGAEVIQIGKTALSWTGQAFGYSIDILEQALKMSLTWTGLSSIVNVVEKIGKTALTWTGQAFSIVGDAPAVHRAVKFLGSNWKRFLQ